MFEKLNLFKRMKEAEDKVAILEDRTELYETQVSTLVEEHQEALDAISESYSLIDRVADAMLRKIEVDEAVARLSDSSLQTVITLGGIDLSLPHGLTAGTPVEAD